jgi:hypothetical protein
VLGSSALAAISALAGEHAIDMALTIERMSSAFSSASMLPALPDRVGLLPIVVVAVVVEVADGVTFKTSCPCSETGDCRLGEVCVI